MGGGALERGIVRNGYFKGRMGKTKWGDFKWRVGRVAEKRREEGHIILFYFILKSHRGIICLLKIHTYYKVYMYTRVLNGVMPHGVIMPPPRTIDFLTVSPVPDIGKFFWVADQRGPRDSPNNIGYSHCSLFPPRT